MMRLYEYSKKVGKSNKELLAILVEGGFELASHMSVVSNEALQYLENQLKRAPEAPSAPKTIHQSDLPSKEPEILTSKVTHHKQDIARTIDLKAPVKKFIIQQMTVGDFAVQSGKSVSEVILALLRQGMACTKNHLLTIPVVESLVATFGIEVEKKSQATAPSLGVSAGISGHETRLPIVVVIGHVDHGKTTLLDYIRKTRVAAREKGGITQHLGAYQADTSHGRIIFLDTPGHEAFVRMRSRGVRVADLAILVVAVDDGIKPQTIEALNQARVAQVPLIVALNKIDRVDQARVEKVKESLAGYGVVPEEWGGDTVFVPLSAKTGQGIDNLLEMISLQAELMELRTDTKAPAKGFVLESKLERGRGAVATIICQQGTLRVGDYFASGHQAGKVTSLTDSFLTRLKEVGPSVPVVVSGFDEMPRAGEFFEVISKEKYHALKSVAGTARGMSGQKSLGENALNIIVKADSDSSKEAVVDHLEKINTRFDQRLHLVFAGIGDVTESDVTLAADTGSVILGLHVKAEPNALVLARKNDTDIKFFDIIYRLFEATEKLLESSKEVKKVTERIGEAVVRRVFKIKTVGVIAGCYVKDGRLVKGGEIIAWRGQTKLGTGVIKSLERENRSAKEVLAGFECAFLNDGFSDWAVDDRVECFVTKDEE